MPYLKQVTIKGNDYYYLFHTVREKGKFKKISRYLGKEKPSTKEIEKLKKQFLSEIKKEPHKIDEIEERKINVVAILQDLQAKKGYLSNEDMIHLSRQLDIPGVYIYGVATFYSQFKLKPSGKHLVSVCTGTACHIKNSASLLQSLEELLKIRSGQTTCDGNITLESVNCIGACALAPAVMIDGIVHGKLTTKKLKKIIEELK